MEIVIQKLTPLSYNSKDAKNKADYQSKICSALERKYKGSVPMFPDDKELYARVYFFTNNGVNIDCDNISKPVWDAIKGLLYVDDRKIVLRTAAVIDLNAHPFNIIDTSMIEGAVAADLTQCISEDDVKCLYIECGEFKESMIKIGENIL